jgi:hypothetical protein
MDTNTELLPIPMPSLDLRPAVDGIMDRFNAAAANLKEGQKLVILMGECHDMPTHIFLQQLLMKNLLEQSKTKFAFGYEFPHNRMARILRKNLKMNIPKEFDSKLQSHDPDGKMLLQLFKKYLENDNAPHSNKNLFSFLLAQKISTRFNDTARLYTSEGVYIDRNDPQTKKILGNHLYFNQQRIDFQSSKGVALRNQMMVQNALQHMQDARVNVYIQQCGSSHLLGIKKQDFPYSPFEESLSALFAQAGAVVLSVFPTVPSQPILLPSKLRDGEPISFLCHDYNKDHIPDAAQEMLKNTQIVEGLSPVDFPSTLKEYLSQDDFSEEEFDKLRYLIDENLYIQAIKDACGGELEIFDPSSQGMQDIDSFIENKVKPMLPKKNP